MKVICAGLPKTGTKSMREALHILGYENVNDGIVQFIEQSEIIESIINGNLTDYLICKNYGHLESFTDLPGSILADRMVKIFPKAKVILMVRENEDMWLKSFKQMRQTNASNTLLSLSQSRLFMFLFNKHFCPLYNKVSRGMIATREFTLPANSSSDCDDDEMRKIYRNYQKKLIKVCEPEQLLIYKVSEGWEPLCRFLGKKIPNGVDFPWLNKNHEIVNAESFKHDGGYTSKTRQEVRTVSIYYAVLLATILTAVLYFVY